MTLQELAEREFPYPTVSEKILEKSYSDELIDMVKPSVDIKRTAFLKGLQYDKWISVEDELPEPDVMVLTYPWTPIYVRHMKIEDGKKVWFFDTFPVTHWQPLPEPPKTK